MNHGKGEEDIQCSISTLFLPVSVSRGGKIKATKAQEAKFISGVILLKVNDSMNEFGSVSAYQHGILAMPSYI